MLTHAFYKALLFLGAGSVIHGDGRRAGHQEDGWRSRSSMPLTAIDVPHRLVLDRRRPAALRLLGEERRAANAWAVTPALWAVGAVTAVVTAYYMGREYLLVFPARRWASSARRRLQTGTRSPTLMSRAR